MAIFSKLFSLGIVYLVILSTAKDANAVRWARWGAWGIWLAGAIASAILVIKVGSGY